MAAIVNFDQKMNSKVDHIGCHVLWGQYGSYDF